MAPKPRVVTSRPVRPRVRSDVSAMARSVRLAGMPVGRLSVVALDCRDPRALAAFYSAITGLEIEDGDDDWVQLRSDGGAALAFQLAPDHEPPVWPSSEHPQQAHLDFDVDDLDVAEEQALAVGRPQSRGSAGHDLSRLPRPRRSSVLPRARSRTRRVIRRSDLQQPSHVGGLADVLQAVVGDAQQAARRA